jgi:hypothetical protein
LVAAHFAVLTRRINSTGTTEKSVRPGGQRREGFSY